MAEDRPRRKLEDPTGEPGRNVGLHADEEIQTREQTRIKQLERQLEEEKTAFGQLTGKQTKLEDRIQVLERALREEKESNAESQRVAEGYKVANAGLRKINDDLKQKLDELKVDYARERQQTSAMNKTMKEAKVKIDQLRAGANKPGGQGVGAASDRVAALERELKELQDKYTKDCEKLIADGKQVISERENQITELRQENERLRTDLFAERKKFEESEAAHEQRRIAVDADEDKGTYDKNQEHFRLVSGLEREIEKLQQELQMYKDAGKPRKMEVLEDAKDKDRLGTTFIEISNQLRKMAAMCFVSNEVTVILENSSTGAGPKVKASLDSMILAWSDYTNSVKETEDVVNEHLRQASVFFRGQMETSAMNNVQGMSFLERMNAIRGRCKAVDEQFGVAKNERDEINTRLSALQRIIAGSDETKSGLIGGPATSATTAITAAQRAEYIEDGVKVIMDKAKASAEWRAEFLQTYIKEWSGAMRKYENAHGRYNRTMSASGRRDPSSLDVSSSVAAAPGPVPGSVPADQTLIDSKDAEMVDAGSENTDYRQKQMSGSSVDWKDVQSRLSSFMSIAASDFEKEIEQKENLIGKLSALTQGGPQQIFSGTPLSGKFVFRIDHLADDVEKFYLAAKELAQGFTDVREKVTPPLNEALAYLDKKAPAVSNRPGTGQINPVEVLIGLAESVSAAAIEYTRAREVETAKLCSQVESFATTYTTIALGLPSLPDAVKEKTEEPVAEQKDSSTEEKTDKDALVAVQSSAPAMDQSSVPVAVQSSAPASGGSRAQQNLQMIAAVAARSSVDRVASVESTMATILGHAKYYAGKTSETRKETETQFVKIQDAIGNLASETKQNFTKSSFDLGQFVSMASIVGQAAVKYKELREQDAKECKELDKVMQALVKELGTDKPLTVLSSLVDTKNVTTSMEAIREEYKTRKTEEQKSLTKLDKALKDLPALVDEKKALESLIPLHKASGVVDTIGNLMGNAIARKTQERKDLESLYGLLGAVPAPFAQPIAGKDSFSIQTAAAMTKAINDKTTAFLGDLGKTYGEATKLVGQEIKDPAGLLYVLKALDKVQKGSKKKGDEKEEEAELEQMYDALPDGEDGQRIGSKRLLATQSLSTGRRTKIRLERKHTFRDIYLFTQKVSGRVNVHTDRSTDSRLLKLPLGDGDSPAYRSQVYMLAMQLYRPGEQESTEALRLRVKQRVARFNIKPEEEEVDVAKEFRVEQAKTSEEKKDKEKEKEKGPSERHEEESSKLATSVQKVIQFFQEIDEQIAEGHFTEVVELVVMPSLMTVLSELHGKLNLYYCPGAMATAASVSPSRGNQSISLEEMLCTDLIVHPVAIMCSESMNTIKAFHPSSFASSTALDITLRQEKSSFDQFCRTYARIQAFEWTIRPTRSVVKGRALGFRMRL